MHHLRSIDEHPVAEGVRPGPADWLIWQLADSALPVGGFAHSGGLEAAWQQGEVRDGAALRDYLDASLDQVGHGMVPLMTAAHDHPDQLERWDRLCDAFTSNHVANRASRVQGRALRSVVERALRGDLDANRFRGLATLPFAHLAPVFGGALRGLGIPRQTSVRLLVFTQLRGMVGAAVRLNIVGPMEAQALLRDLAGRGESVCARCERLTVAELAQTSPLLDLWQGSQDRLYSRLFQS
jgi:urease accessory protein